MNPCTARNIYCVAPQLREPRVVAGVAVVANAAKQLKRPPSEAQQ